MEVGIDTHNDLKAMFEKLNKGMKARRKKLDKPKCSWNGSLESEKFVDVEDLFLHVKSHI